MLKRYTFNHLTGLEVFRGQLIGLCRNGKGSPKRGMMLSYSNVLPIQRILLKKGFGSNLPRWLAAPATLSKVQAVKGNEVQARQRRPLYSASTAQ